MGFGGISLWQLLIVLLIVLLIFGTKRLKSVGGDLGSGLKSFRKAMDSDEEDSSTNDETKDQSPQLESGESDAEFVEQKDKSKSSET
jgi:sec-independent protein translocase protein TatA|tara:strand:- start:1656 stop:1916 length:261 start_codon:yes stop_codon:yes gene_type:complete